MHSAVVLPTQKLTADIKYLHLSTTDTFDILTILFLSRWTKLLETLKSNIWLDSIHDKGCSKLISVSMISSWINVSIEEEWVIFFLIISYLSRVMMTWKIQASTWPPPSTEHQRLVQDLASNSEPGNSRISLSVEEWVGASSCGTGWSLGTGQCQWFKTKPDQCLIVTLLT